MIPRPLYTNQLKAFIDKPLVKIITGIRRCGKSTVLHLLKEDLIGSGVKEEQIVLINFESFRFSEYKTAQKLYNYVKSCLSGSSRHYLLLDEIQEVTEWEKAINSFLVDFNVDIYITGSNSHMLSSELATLLAGRYVEVPVYTLSYLEYLDFKGISAGDMALANDSFEGYLRMGGFPVIHTNDFDTDSAYKVVRDIYSSVILRDTVQRYGIRDVEMLERVVRYAFDNIGNTFSGKSVADFFKSQQRKVDINTIYNYLHALQGAFILYRVPRYDIKGKEILKTFEKYYVSDLSLIYSTMGFRDRIISGFLENIVFLELKRRGYSVYVGKSGNREVDFVAEKPGERIYIQVAYKLESQQTVDREFSPLLDIYDHYPKYVITLDPFWKDSIEGIKHITLPRFLGEKSNFLKL